MHFTPRSDESGIAPRERWTLILSLPCVGFRVDYYLNLHLGTPTISGPPSPSLLGPLLSGSVCLWVLVEGVSCGFWCACLCWPPFWVLDFLSLFWLFAWLCLFCLWGVPPPFFWALAPCSLLGFAACCAPLLGKRRRSLDFHLLERGL